MTRRKAKSEIPPFDAKCKNCDRPIPKPLKFCSSKCRRQYENIKLKWIPLSHKKSFP